MKTFTLFYQYKLHGIWKNASIDFEVTNREEAEFWANGYIKLNNMQYYFFF